MDAIKSIAIGGGICLASFAFIFGLCWIKRKAPRVWNWLENIVLLSAFLMFFFLIGTCVRALPL